MESLSQILIVAKPGHFRDSLVAVLKTLPRSELFLVDRPLWDDDVAVSQALQTLLLADLDGMGDDETASLGSLKKRYPGMRCVLMVNNHQQIQAAKEYGADAVLPRTTSAGELLTAIQRLNGGNPGAARHFRPFPVYMVP